MTYYSALGIIRGPQEYTFDAIETIVCQFYSQSLDRIYSNSHKEILCWCRHLICFFAVELMGASLKTIGRRIGRHYTTVIDSRKAVMNRKSVEQMFAAEVNEMRKRIVKVSHIGS